MADSVFDANGHVHLDARETMYAVHAELAGGDGAKFRGNVSAWQEGDAGVSQLELNDNTQEWPAIVCLIGDHLVLMMGRLLKFTDAEYQAAQ